MSTCFSITTKTCSKRICASPYGVRLPGQRRLTALIDQVILPEQDERLLHGNASSSLLTWVVRFRSHVERKLVWHSCTVIQAQDGKA